MLHEYSLCSSGTIQQDKFFTHSTGNRDEAIFLRENISGVRYFNTLKSSQERSIGTQTVNSPNKRCYTFAQILNFIGYGPV